MAGNWKRRRGIGGEKKKLLAGGISVIVLVLAVFGAGKTGLSSAAAVQEERTVSGANAYAVLSSCSALWFPHGVESVDGGKGEAKQDGADGLTYFLADRLMEGMFWYRATERGEDVGRTKPDPAYGRYKKKQEQAKEYSRLADALSASQVFSDSDEGSVLESERQGAASAGSSDLSAVSPSPAIGTTAGRNLLERAGLPVTGENRTWQSSWRTMIM